MPRRKGHRETGEHACKTCAHPECARIDFLSASGAQLKPLAEQFGISCSSLHNHFKKHVSDRYKKIIGASRLESFEALMSRCTEGDAETLDILALLIRGHSQQWAIALEGGAPQAMVSHANKILAATELRSKITRELVPAQTLTVNNYLMKDAAQLVDMLQSHPDAAEEVLRWHERRNSGRVIEHAPHAAD
jgi:hypothetical protein